MQKKNGISLIVLIITIIVMIILAGVIMISLNNSGIIKRAEQAVEDTNLQEIRNLAVLKWSEVYLKGGGKYTQPKLEKEVLAALKEEEIDLTPYEIIVTEKGVTVEKIPTIADLEAAHTFEYYSTLSLAIEDVNNDAIGTNADVEKKDAVAGIYTEDGAITVVLLKDATENSKIEPNKDVTINLGGNTLTFTSNLGISGAKDHTDTITIDGRLEGSSIIVNGSGAGTRAIQTRTNTIIVNGGTYYANFDVASSRETTVFVVHTSSGSKLEMNNCRLYTSNSVINSAEHRMKVYAISASSGSEINLTNCYLEAKLVKGSPNGVAMGINGYGDAELTNCTIKAYSDYIKGNGEYDNPLVYSNGIWTNFDTNYRLIDCNIMGVHSGVSSNGNIYIDGGTYEGYGFGGLNIAGDGKGTEKIYIKNATLSALQMLGSYTDLDVGYGAKSMNIGDHFDSDNMKIYMDNCKVTNAITYRADLGATHNELYISNSIINEKIRIDNDTHRLYIGKGNTSKGNKFDISNVEIPSGVDLEKVVEETDEVYVK